MSCGKHVVLLIYLVPRVLRFFLPAVSRQGDSGVVELFTAKILRYKMHVKGRAAGGHATELRAFGARFIGKTVAFVPGYAPLPITKVIKPNKIKLASL